MSFPGFVTPYGLVAGAHDLVSIVASTSNRKIGDITLNVTIEEEGTDELEITQHPVEQGAAISDHAYKRPAYLRIRAASSNSSSEAAGSPSYVQDIYDQLLALQSSGQVFTVVTGKRSYDNMLMASLRQQTDVLSEAALFVVMEFREILIARTSSTAVPPVQNQAAPQQTAATQDLGAKQLQPAVPITPPVN